ncbi:hypothetical protein CI105_02855 [Candidatus Izimaplasma bacterium ZiA1]|uniref:tocopherol cyclase family protein n=1 Tax=Candidatus Izimoplasma sp. ZiA1 TaxID=2024899 RepID=UPI000BAA46BD|nr:hypothetical protein CI105_02855 [Candidatus Izimaplasma bacterium ZiA1]
MNLFNYENKREVNYFEGWYLRLTDLNNDINIAVIFAVTKYQADQHSFIQVLDSINKKTYYYRFSIEDFLSENNQIIIQGNLISPNALKLETTDFKIDVKLTNHTFLKQKKNKSTSAMGYLKNFPLQCFQDVIFLDALFAGKIKLNSKTYFASGKSYMEKTYGNKFPEKWLWVQSNHSSSEAKFTLALGIIPVLFLKIKGFFCILRVDDVEYKFAIYNFARIKVTKVSNDSIKVILKKGKYKIVLLLDSLNALELLGPALNGKMGLKVFESVSSKMTLKLYKKNNLVFSEQTNNVGFENMFFR